MKKLLSLLLLFPLLFCSCSKDKASDRKKIEKAKPIVLNSEFANKLSSNNAFAFDLFNSTVSNSNKGENIFISPLSVNMALSMTWNGADGETFTEMQQVLRNDGYTINHINEYSKELREALLKVDPTTKLIIANSIWANKSRFTLKDDFVATNKKHYDAEVKNVDFALPRTLIDINGWCASKTNNLIPEALDEIHPNAALFIINALYFKGIWCSKFDSKNTANSPFNNYDGSKSIVKMMRQTENFRYGDNNSWRYLEMPYGNSAFTMAIMIPQNEKNIKDILPNLDAATFKQLLSNAETHTVAVKLPRFRAEYSYEMQEGILPEMGMKLAFLPQADFSKMGDKSTMISRVIHKTFVEVNEEGTEAAAVTIIENDFTSHDPSNRIIEFYVDQPFVYIIKENSTGAILFMGLMNKM